MAEYDAKGLQDKEGNGLNFTPTHFLDAQGNSHSIQVEFGKKQNTLSLEADSADIDDSTTIVKTLDGAKLKTALAVKFWNYIKGKLGFNSTSGKYGIDISGNANTASVATAAGKLSSLSITSSSSNTKQVRLVAGFAESLAAHECITIIIHFFSDGDYSDEAFLKVSFKAGSSANTVGDVYAKWLARTSGIAEDAVTIGAVCSSSASYVNVLYTVPRAYLKMSFSVIDEKGTGWIKYSSNEASTDVAFATIGEATSVLSGYAGKSSFDLVAVSSDNNTNIGGDAHSVDGYHVVVGQTGSAANTIYFF